MTSPPRTETERTEQRILWALLAVALLLGFGVRLYHYVVNRSLFLDEASLALNLMRRSWVELLQPLDHYQGAPLGFLFAQAALMRAFGSSERVLRLLPLLASLAGLLCYPPTLAQYAGTRSSEMRARRVRVRDLAPRPLSVVVLATALFAVANYAVYYAVESKQYALDILATIVLLWSAAPLFAPAPRTRDLVVFGATAAAAVCFSFPAVFVIAALVMTVGAGAAWRRQWRTVAQLALSALPAALLFGLFYLVVLGNLTGDSILTNFWAFAFAPLPPWRDWGWFPRTLTAIMGNPIDLPWRGTWVLLLVGFGVVLVRHRPFAVAFALAAAFTLAASAVQAYPFAARLLLFLLPFFWFLAASAVEWAAGLIPNRSLAWAVGGVLSLLLLAGVGSMTVRRALTPYNWREHYRPALEFMAAHVQEGDAAYCSTGACPPLAYYAARGAFPPVRLQEGAYYGAFPETSVAELDALQGEERVWVVIARPYPGDDAALLAHLDTAGTQLDAFSAYGVQVYLYDLAK